jgi:hypothetical protein
MSFIPIPVEVEDRVLIRADFPQEIAARVGELEVNSR